MGLPDKGEGVNCPYFIMKVMREVLGLFGVMERCPNARWADRAEKVDMHKTRVTVVMVQPDLQRRQLHLPHGHRNLARNAFRPKAISSTTRKWCNAEDAVSRRRTSSNIAALDLGLHFLTLPGMLDE